MELVAGGKDNPGCVLVPRTEPSVCSSETARNRLPGIGDRVSYVVPNSSLDRTVIRSRLPAGSRCLTLWMVAAQQVVRTRRDHA